ncbi:hypothetical protein Salat_0851000 [Sesamum alatum]|uniref:Uncharacterized protein n=1 Tax=Sesamum alatum TaxID=300844 RepID=A0AAE1YJC4_9LAMI|nr:hypothetical protein Salat_0851000 [Sesamum alatum]
MHAGIDSRINWLKDDDECTRIFFEQVRAMKVIQRVYQIHNNQGDLVTKQSLVIREFLDYFEVLIGGRRQRVIDPAFLQPWLRYGITENEAGSMVHAVTDKEIKESISSIKEEKAPRPDGYSAGFYKGVWPVVREKVSVAIKEFFSECLAA